MMAVLTDQPDWSLGKMGESFWQNNRLVTHILFELQPIIIFSPVANFGNQSIVLVGPGSLYILYF